MLFPEITIDYETTILSEKQKQAIMSGELEKNLCEVFAYSVQLGICWQTANPKDEAHPINRYEAHIFLDERLKDTATQDIPDGTFLHWTKGDCVIAGVEWLEALFLKYRGYVSNSRKQRKKFTIKANAFNCGYEESYSVYSLLKMGYTSAKVIPRGMGGTMISSFLRTEEYANKNGEITERVYNFQLQETAGQWGAGTKLEQIFGMYGLGGKTDTPLFTFSDGSFFDDRTGKPAWITKEFLLYAAKDVVGLAIALRKKRGENGQARTMTASSTTLWQHKQKFIEVNGEEAYDHFFQPASLKFDAWIRPLTLGGYNFCNPIYKNHYLDETKGFDVFLGIDRTNAYLSCMCSGAFPIGDDIYFEGKYEEDKTYPFYFQKIRINSCLLKQDYMPSLQIKHGVAEDVYGIHMGTPEEDRYFILNDEELNLFKESYAQIDIEYIDGYKFDVADGDFLFGFYLKKLFYDRRNIKHEMADNKEMRKNAGANEKLDREYQEMDAKQNTLKLWGNGLYGKEFENPNKEQGYWYLGEDDEPVFETEPVIMERRSASYLGSQILRKQRCALIKACNKVIAAGAVILQADTDAFLAGIPHEMMEKNPTLDAVELCNIAGVEYGDDIGQWHEEKVAREGLTVEKKVYAWSHDALTAEERKMTYGELKAAGHKFYFGTRGVKKSDAIKQLSPNTWRKGQSVKTTQFARMSKARKAQINIVKVLAI